VENVIRSVYAASLLPPSAVTKNWIGRAMDVLLVEEPSPRKFPYRRIAHQFAYRA
jgi:hypothetical protein